MIEQIKGLEIEGRKFQTPKAIEFFESTKNGAVPQRIAFIYGHNGVGKTTIASAFRQNCVADKDDRLSVSLIKDDETRIPLPDTNSIVENAIRVFDEKYVDEKIKLKPDKTGLGSIVMFSDAGNLQDQIDEAEAALLASANNIDDIDIEIENLQNVNNPSSYLYIWETIKDILKAGWAEDDKRLKGSSRKSSVNDAVAEWLCKLNPQTANEQIEVEIADTEKKLAELDEAGEISSVPPVQPISISAFDETAMVSLLNQIIEQPTLSEREKRILHILGHIHGRIDEVRQSFDTAIDYCPYCFRPMTGEEKTDLIRSIEKVLNRAVDEYKTRLNGITLCVPIFNHDLYKTIDEPLCDEISILMEKIRECMESYRSDIGNKSANVYQTTKFPNRGLTALLEESNGRLVELEAKRTSLVTLAQHRQDLTNDLFRLYNEKAHYQVAPQYATYLQQESLLSSKIDAHKKESEKFDKIEEHLNSLKAQKRGTDIAIKYINKSLSYIYASKTRFAVEIQGEDYILKSYGQNIKPSDVSTGERHVLALAYFFADIMANKEETKFYKDETMLVIDDPVSSFDTENKIGVFSFLVREFGRVLAGNKNSRIITLTHDVHTMINLAKAGETLVKDVLPPPKSKIRQLTISSDGNLSNFNPESHNEYSALLWDIYDYAKSEQCTTNAFTVGNQIRRVLEAYATFLYRKDFLALFYDADSRAKLGKLAEYFASKMDRTILNGESHLKYQTLSISNDANFFAEISDNDKLIAAKDVLCLLLMLDRNHVKYHFEKHPKDTKALETIEKWRKELEDKVLSQ